MKTPKTILRTGFRCGMALAVVAAIARADERPAQDLDGDGIPNLVDPDIDNDGLPNSIDPNIDGGIAKTGPYAGRYIGDRLDNDNPAERDIDGDGHADDSLGEIDIDGDAFRDDDDLERDIDGDGLDDDSPLERDIDGDGRFDDDYMEDDIDGDGRDDDDDDLERDIDGDGVPDDFDDDSDGDGSLNSSDFEFDTDGDGLLDADSREKNDDGDSYGDRDDDDDDNDGIRDDRDHDHHPEDDEVEVERYLDRVGPSPAESEAKVSVQRMAFGNLEFEVEAEGLPVGDYDIFVDGVFRGVLPVDWDDDETEGEVEYETYPNDDDERLLDFEVIGLPIEIGREGVVYFSGIIPTPPAVPTQGEDEDDDDDDYRPIIGSAVYEGFAPEFVTGLSWVLRDGDEKDLIEFLTDVAGREIELGDDDVEDFAYSYERDSDTTARLVVSFEEDDWEEYVLNFENGAFVRREYDDGELDEIDAGVFLPESEWWGTVGRRDDDDDDSEDDEDRDDDDGSNEGDDEGSDDRYEDDDGVQGDDHEDNADGEEEGEGEEEEGDDDDDDADDEED